MKKIEVFLEIKPQAQERLRFKFSGWGKKRNISAYTPEKTREFQDTIRETITEFISEENLSEFPKNVPVKMTAIFYLSRPISAKKRVRPVVRPDLSNYIKSLEDGLQRVSRGKPAALEDDSSICMIVSEKRYVDKDYPTPGILLKLEVL